MRTGVIILSVALTIAAGYYWRLDKKLLSLLPQLQKKESLPTLSVSPADTLSTGRVAGVSTEKLQGIGESVLQKGSTLGKTVSTLVLENSATTENTINVKEVVSQISKQVESIPSGILHQAKVAYCTQVLIEATKSANSQ